MPPSSWLITGRMVITARASEATRVTVRTSPMVVPRSWRDHNPGTAAGAVTWLRERSAVHRSASRRRHCAAATGPRKPSPPRPPTWQLRYRPRATLLRMSALSRQSRLFLLSFLMLFVELALIRWIGAKVVYLSYFSNFVLLASFLGIGMGFLRARSATNLFPLAPVLLAAMMAFVIVFPVQINRSGSDLIFFGALENSGTGLPIWATLPVIFVAVAAVMVSIAEGVARIFAELDPLRAYQLDLLGR